jgi:hypothetical protein
MRPLGITMGGGGFGYSEASISRKSFTAGERPPMGNKTEINALRCGEACRFQTPGGERAGRFRNCFKTVDAGADMSRYYFNLIGEHSVDDLDGLDLADEVTARLHAIELAQALMRRTRLFRANPEQWSMQLLDAERREIAIIPFSEAAKLGAGCRTVNGRTDFAGRLDYKVQLQLGKAMATADNDILELEIPEQFRELLTRLEHVTPDESN